MRVTTVKLRYKRGEVFHLTPLSDLHLESVDCDRRSLLKLVRERAALPNHRFMGVGDWGDWIVPSDRKRHKPSGLVKDLRGSDDLLNDTVQYIADNMAEAAPLDLLADGNHEASIVKSSTFHPTAALAKAMGTEYGGYCGFLRYRMLGPNNESTSLTILYHHGAWCGQQATPPSAVRWARDGFSGWDLFLFGHNHKSGHVRRAEMLPPNKGSTSAAVARDYHIVACGSHLRNYQHGASSRGSGYAEQSGMQPTSISAPLISWRVVEHGNTRRDGLPKRSIKIDVNV